MLQSAPAHAAPSDLLTAVSAVIGASIDIAVIALVWWVGHRIGLWQWVGEARRRVRAEPSPSLVGCQWSGCDNDAPRNDRYCDYHHWLWWMDVTARK